MQLPIVDAAAPSPPTPLPGGGRYTARCMTHLDDLWFQVAGTTCNLTCNHCFISCSPHNHNFGFLDLESIRRAYVNESVVLGVKDTTSPAANRFSIAT